MLPRGVDAHQSRQGARAYDAAMHRTYELYLHDGKGGWRFEPFMCECVAEVMHRARTLAEEVSCVEVKFAGDLLFTIAGAPTNPAT
jgi:hypothetical protein